MKQIGVLVWMLLGFLLKFCCVTGSILCYDRTSPTYTEMVDQVPRLCIGCTLCLQSTYILCVFYCADLLRGHGGGIVLGCSLVSIFIISELMSNICNYFDTCSPILTRF